MKILYLPPQYLEADASPEDKAVYEQYKLIMRNIHIGQDSGMILPQVLDDNGEQNVKFEVLSTTGKKSYNVHEIIERYKSEIIVALYANSLVTGMSGGGSMALSESQIKMRDDIIESFLAEIADVLNHHLIPRIFKWNGWEVTEYPKFVHAKVSEVTQAERGKVLYQAAAAGLLYVTAKNYNAIQEDLGMPERLPLDTPDEVVRSKLSKQDTRAGDGFKTTGSGTSDNVSGDSSASNAHNK